MKQKTNTRILVYTLVAIVVIASYITINSFQTQLSIYQEKELFKLDCIANAVAYKISGDEHDQLITKYPPQVDTSLLKQDSVYQSIFNQMYMAQVMTQVPSAMQTIVQLDTGSHFYQAISTEDSKWLMRLNHGHIPDSIYKKGGMIGLYETVDGKKLGAASPLMNAKGEVIGVLKVEETFDSFFSKAKDQIYTNIIITLIFITIIGTLMFFSVKSLLKQQEKLQKERNELEQFRQDLMANVSHDLRTPLAGIHGYIETMIIKKDELDEQTCQSYLQSALSSTSKLKYMVDELFELSKLESKERKLVAETFSIRELAYDIAGNFKIQANEKAIQFEIDAPEDIHSVTADLGMIDRVISNLLSNAIKYCEAGDKVTLALRNESNGVRVSVIDTGRGIAEEDVPKLFDRFFKGKSAQPGTGLGLAIVKSILELHGSQCQVKSKLNAGTTFSFMLNI